MSKPITDLERAFTKALNGAAGYPEFFRQLRAAKLFSLVPYHPEMAGTGTILSNQSFTFKLVGDERGPGIPLFLSRGHAKEALKSLHASATFCTVIEMQGDWLLQAMALHDADVVVNPACRGGSIRIDHTTLIRIADGSILQTRSTGTDFTSYMVAVPPADYPTGFVQPIFQFLRDRPEVRAAWVLREEPPTSDKPCYVIGLLVTGDMAVFQDDLDLIARVSCPPEAQYGLAALDATVPALANLMAQNQPFYAALDYRPPPPAAVAPGPD